MRIFSRNLYVSLYKSKPLILQNPQGSGWSVYTPVNMFEYRRGPRYTKIFILDSEPSQFIDKCQINEVFLTKGSFLGGLGHKSGNYSVLLFKIRNSDVYKLKYVSEMMTTAIQFKGGTEYIQLAKSLFKLLVGIDYSYFKNGPFNTLSCE